MRRKLKMFVIYFPVILVVSQVGINMLYFISPGIYNDYSFYLATLFGTNFMFAVFLVVFTFMFKFCSVSRWAALAELLFALYYLVIQKDDIYNLVFQITAGGLAIIVTLYHYAKKFPLCGLGLLASFISSMFTTGSCDDALKHWDMKTENKLEKHISNDYKL